MIGLVLFLMVRIAYMLIQSHAWVYQQFEHGEMADWFLKTGHFYLLRLGILFDSAEQPPGLIFITLFFKKYMSLHFFVALATFHVAIATLSFLVYRKLSQKLLAPGAVMLASALYIFDPNLLSITRWFNETLYTSFFITVLIYLVSVTKEMTVGKSVSLGLCLGFGMLFRTTFEVYALFAIGWMVHQKFSSKFLAVVILTFSCVIAPWAIRNYRVLHRFIPVSQDMGDCLFEGWSPDAVGAMQKLDGESLVYEPSLEAKLRACRSESEFDKILVSYSVHCAIENPLRWLKQRCLGCLFFWSEQSMWAPKSPFHNRQDIIIGIINLLIVAIFFWSVPSAWREGEAFKLILLFILVHSMIYTLIHADVGNRYRLQIEPLLLIIISNRFGRYFKGAHNKPSERIM
jgi:hypothetical protein